MEVFQRVLCERQENLENFLSDTEGAFCHVEIAVLSFLRRILSALTIAANDFVFKEETSVWSDLFCACCHLCMSMLLGTKEEFEQEFHIALCTSALLAPRPFFVFVFACAVKSWHDAHPLCRKFLLRGHCDYPATAMRMEVLNNRPSPQLRPLFMLIVHGRCVGTLQNCLCLCAALSSRQAISLLQHLRRKRPTNPFYSVFSNVRLLLHLTEHHIAIYWVWPQVVLLLLPADNLWKPQQLFVVSLIWRSHHPTGWFPPVVIPLLWHNAQSWAEIWPSQNQGGTLCC